MVDEEDKNENVVDDLKKQLQMKDVLHQQLYSQIEDLKKKLSESNEKIKDFDGLQKEHQDLNLLQFYFLFFYFLFFIFYFLFFIFLFLTDILITLRAFWITRLVVFIAKRASN